MEIPNIETIIPKAMEQAFSKALVQMIQQKAEVLFKKTLATELEKKIEDCFNRGIRSINFSLGD